MGGCQASNKDASKQHNHNNSNSHLHTRTRVRTIQIRTTVHPCNNYHHRNASIPQQWGQRQVLTRQDRRGCGLKQSSVNGTAPMSITLTRNRLYASSYTCCSSK